MDLLEVIQPELQIVVAWIVLNKTQLGPAHRPAVPAFRLLACVAGSGRNDGCERRLLALKSNQAARGKSRGLL